MVSSASCFFVSSSDCAKSVSNCLVSPSDFCASAMRFLSFAASACMRDSASPTDVCRARSRSSNDSNSFLRIVSALTSTRTASSSSVPSFSRRPLSRCTS